MMSNFQDPGLADTGPDADQEYDHDRHRDSGPQQGGPPAAPQPVQPAINTLPVQPMPGEATTAADPGPQDDANAPRTTAPTVEKAPDEDGRIPYTHTGDGVTERVWPSVADAYEAAYSNKEGTDGKAAYTGTDAEWLDEKELEPVDPSDLASGDLITFDDGSAVVRVQPEEGDPEGGIVEVIIKGELTPIAEVMADGAGELGRFAGFRRPPGIAPPGSTEGSAGVTEQRSPGAESGDATVPV
ncbi:hypothetical protein [Nocardia fusca]|uniref:hypothetical protein n=1 Tax=Nocardia fusca TaxID=941183 RepID=UPI0007A75B50|nr:hypothetical protein [Nocardia fusca]